MFAATTEGKLVRANKGEREKEKRERERERKRVGASERRKRELTLSQRPSAGKLHELSDPGATTTFHHQSDQPTGGYTR